MTIEIGIAIYVFIGLIVLGIAIGTKIFSDGEIDLFIFVLAVLLWPVLAGMLMTIPFQARCDKNAIVDESKVESEASNPDQERG